MNEDKNRLILVDGHAMLYRAYFAFPQSLTTRNGELVNAVYGFTSILLSVIRDLKPTHLAVSFDVGETFRHEQYPEYKAHREKMPEELKEQEPRAYEVIAALNIPLYVKEGFEADDVIGSLASQASSYRRQATGDKLNTVIVTGDKDILQLVVDRKGDLGAVEVYMPGRGIKGPTRYDEAKVMEDLGIRPDQVPDLKGLAGDSSDNIPGIKGIGIKTATKLLKEFGSIEGIYEYLETRNQKLVTSNEEILKPAVIRKIVEGRGSAFESKRLATIVTDVPVRLDLEMSTVQKYDKEKTVHLFEELEFRSLMNKLPNDEFEQSVQEALF